MSDALTSELSIEPPRCLKCHKKMSPPTAKWPVWKCARCWTEWAGPRDGNPQPTDDVRTSSQHTGTVDGPVLGLLQGRDDVEASAQHTGNGQKPNGYAILLVEWKPERGLYRISSAAETEPAHPWWHLSSCLFRQFDVEWIRRTPRE